MVHSAYPAERFGPLCPPNEGTGHFVTLRFSRDFRFLTSVTWSDWSLAVEGLACLY